MPALNENKIPNLLKIFGTFFKIAFFNIGGGYVTLPLMEKDIVNTYKWLSKEEFIDIIAVSQSIPGVLAVNYATFIGFKLRGILGSIAAALGMVLPSFICLFAIIYLVFNIRDAIYMQKAFMGVKAGVAALIAITAIKMAKVSIKSKLDIFITISCLLALIIFDVNAIYCIIGGAFLGYVKYLILRRWVKKS